jgi:cardiolipin synthase
MLQAIRSAQRTITFETYIYWSGRIGQAFADALSERARSGVKVHLLLDWVGSSKMDASMLQAMEQAGVQVQRYHALRWYSLSRLNNRTHRKLLVVDGIIGFTGGVGIADEWTGHAEDPDHWRDAHFRVEGPVVAQMQTVFMDNWIKATGQVLHGEPYFPPVTPAGNTSAQTFSSSPTGGADSVHLMYLLAISAAQQTIHLANSYFVPDQITLDALLAALARGVKVQIIVPGPHTDAQTVRRASRAQWGELLRAGAQVYEFQPTMFHCKVLVVDGLLTSVGSTNFDNRSFKLNDEANLNIYDAAFAQQQIAVFEGDLTRSRRYTLQQWNERSLGERLWEHAASLLSSQL